jgi:hypothetical protein
MMAPWLKEVQNLPQRRKGAKNTRKETPKVLNSFAVPLRLRAFAVEF